MNTGPQYLFMEEPRWVPPGVASLGASKSKGAQREPTEISHFVALAALRFRWAMGHVRAARATESEEWRLIQEAKASEQLLRVEEELSWARATVFDTCSTNPAYSSQRAESGEEEAPRYIRCGHQHPSILEAEACIMEQRGNRNYGSVHVYGSPDLSPWWTPEQARLQDYYTQRNHERALEVARTTPPRKLKFSEMIGSTGITSCNIIGCGSEAPNDTRVCLACHQRLYLEANPEAAQFGKRKAVPASTPQAPARDAPAQLDFLGKLKPRRAALRPKGRRSRSTKPPATPHPPTPAPEAVTTEEP